MPATPNPPLQAQSQIHHGTPERLPDRPIKAIFPLATLGATTARGGTVASASTGICIEGHRIACVGDVVRYPDGSESKIVSGAGVAMMFEGKPIAIVCSATDNGDTIVRSLQDQGQIWECADDVSIAGFLEAGYNSHKAGQGE